MTDPRRRFLLELLATDDHDAVEWLAESPAVVALFEPLEAELHALWQRLTGLTSVVDAAPTPVAATTESTVDSVADPAPVTIVDVVPAEPSTALEADATEPAVAATPPDLPPAPPIPAFAAPLMPPPLVLRPVPSFKLRNARQNEPFDERLVISPPHQLIELLPAEDWPDHLGLTLEPTELRVHGVPRVQGEFALSLRYRFVDEPPSAVRHTQLALFINPDPRLLWKNLPSDRSDPLWKPDSACEFIAGDLRCVVAARQRGRSHAHVGSCCDDDFFITHLAESGWYLAVVADGAGSAGASRRGSQVAVRSAGEYLSEHLPGAAGLEVIAAANALAGAADDPTAVRGLHHSLYKTIGYAAHLTMRALVDEAKRLDDRPLKDLATTLLIGLTRKIGEQWLCAAYWVGDGAVGIFQEGQSVQLLGEVDSGEYSGQTRFLSAAEVAQEALLKRTRFALVDDYTALVLMTDGVSDPGFDTEASLAKLAAWEVLWKDLQQQARLQDRDPGAATRLLEWLDFWSPGNHDDRTIALIY